MNKVDQKLATDLAIEFCNRLNEIQGLYLDCTMGFHLIINTIEKVQTSVSQMNSNKINLDAVPFVFGMGHPDDPKAEVQHKVTQGELKERNKKGGKNHLLLSQYFIVLVFHLWEHEYRPKISNALNIAEKDELKVPILGDLRVIRNEILKHRGIITKTTVKKLTVLKNIEADKNLSLSNNDLVNIIKVIRQQIDQLIMDRIGEDPGLRNVVQYIF